MLGVREAHFDSLYSESRLSGCRSKRALSALKETFQFQNLESEIEARWQLVERAWSLGINTNILITPYTSGPDVDVLLSAVDRVPSTLAMACRIIRQEKYNSGLAGGSPRGDGQDVRLARKNVAGWLATQCWVTPCTWKY